MLDFVDKLVEKGFYNIRVGHSDPVKKPLNWNNRLRNKATLGITG